MVKKSDPLDTILKISIFALAVALLLFCISVFFPLVKPGLLQIALSYFVVILVIADLIFYIVYKIKFYSRKL